MMSVLLVIDGRSNYVQIYCSWNELLSIRMLSLEITQRKETIHNPPYNFMNTLKMLSNDVVSCSCRSTKVE